MDSEGIRRRIAEAPWVNGVVLNANWLELEPNGPVVGGYPALREPLEWVRALGRPLSIQISCVGAITHDPTEIPRWVADHVQTVNRLGHRSYLVPWDQNLRTQWQGFVESVAETVLPLMTSPLKFGTVSVAQPGQDPEMNVTELYLKALRTGFSDDYTEGAWVNTWLQAEAFTRAIWGASRILTCSPGTITVSATTEIFDAFLEANVPFALSNGNLASYPDNAPSEWQQFYLEQFPMAGLTETPYWGEDPAVALDAEFHRVYVPLGLRRLTCKPNAAGVSHDGATPEHEVVLRRIAAYLQRTETTAG